jgi:hypothetical protein
MNKLKQYFSLAIVFWGAANLSQSSLAQYWVPIQPPVPSHDIMFPGVRERSIDQNKGADPTPRFSSPNPSPSPSLNARYVKVISVSPSLEQFCALVYKEKTTVTYGPGDLIEVKPFQGGNLKFRQDFHGTVISAIHSICGG